MIRMVWRYLPPLPPQRQTVFNDIKDLSHEILLFFVLWLLSNHA